MHFLVAPGKSVALLTQDGNGLLCSTDDANATATATATATSFQCHTVTTLPTLTTMIAAACSVQMLLQLLFVGHRVLLSLPHSLRPLSVIWFYGKDALRPSQAHRAQEPKGLNWLKGPSQI